MKTKTTQMMQCAQDILPQLRQWGEQNAKSRQAASEPLPRALLPAVQELEWDLRDWAIARQERRVGLYGASQAGKSTFVDRLLQTTDGSSPFPTSESVSYMQDINPPGAGLEATAVVTKYFPSSTGDVPPVLVLADRQELLGVLSVGFHLTADLESPGVFSPPADLADVEEFLEKMASDVVAHSWPGWRNDILRTYKIARRRMGVSSFPIEFQDLYARLNGVVSLTPKNCKTLAGLLLWRNSENVSRLFEDLSEHPLMSLSQIEVPWSSLRLILSRVLQGDASEPRRSVSTGNFGQRSWDDYGLSDTETPRMIPDSSGARLLDGLVVHAFAHELRIPVDTRCLKPEGRRLFDEFRLVDFPGARQHPERYTEDDFAGTKARLGMVERGRIDFSFLISGAIRPLDSLLFVQKYGVASEAGTLSKLLEEWLSFWMTNEPNGLPALPPTLFAGMSHFDEVLKVLDSAGNHDIERYFQQEVLPNFPASIRPWVGGETPFDRCYWLAMTPDPIKNKYEPAVLNRLHAAYLTANAIRDCIGAPEAKWDMVFDDPTGGVASMTEAMDAREIDRFVDGKYQLNLCTRLNDLIQLLTGALPATDGENLGVDRAELAARLSEGYLNTSSGGETAVLKAFSVIRRAFEVPALQMNSNAGASSSEKVRGWHQDLVSGWAVNATKRLSKIDPRNAEEWTRLVGWLKDALRRKDLQDQFVATIGTMARRTGGEELNTQFPEFAATIVGDQFFRSSLKTRPRAEVPKIFDSSKIPWRRLVEETFVEPLVWHAKESAAAGGRPALAGDDDGVRLYRELSRCLNSSSEEVG